MIYPPMAAYYSTVDETAAHIAGVPQHLKDEAARGMLSKIFPEFMNTSSVVSRAGGANPLGAESVLMSDFDAVLNLALWAPVFKIVKLRGFITADGGKGETEKVIRLLGALSGKPQRAEYLLSRHAAKMQQLYVRVPADKPVLNIVYFNGESFRLTDMLLPNFNDSINKLGASNMAQLMRGRTNIEQLLVLNPDIIFLFDYDNPVTVNYVYNHPVLACMDAVKNRRVYRMLKMPMRLNGPVDEPLFFAWMSELLHPEITPETSLRQEIKDTYLELYGYEISEDDIDEMLHVNENSSSTGYERFLLSGR
jgi:iron complex transport system substrate-binding protein